MNHQISKAIMDKTTTAVSYGTSGTVGLGGLVSSDWIMVFAAIFFAALTFGVNWWYQQRKDKREAEHMVAAAHLESIYQAAREAREKELHELRLAKLRGSDEVSGD